MIFKDQENESKSGLFRVEGQNLIAIDKRNGNGSIYSCVETLGFARNQIRTILTFHSDKIECLGFKILSEDLVMVLLKNLHEKISFSEVQKEVAQINWSYEYSSLNIEDILNEGIDHENLTMQFLRSVMDLKEEGENVYKSEKLGLYLQFENDVLTAFTSSGWDNSATKWLANLNPPMVKKMTDEAKIYHQNDMDSMEEVNKQAKSLLGTPEATSNKFLPLHTKSNGNVSFYNLLITHYKKECSMSEFLFMNKGRYRSFNSYTFEVGNFVYTFDIHGQLQNIVNK